MKRNLWGFGIVTLVVFVFQSTVAFACAMDLIPSTSTAKVGDTVGFRLERAAIHRSCVLPLEQTTIRISGGELVDPGVWSKGKVDVLEFSVKFTQPGTAIVKIERDCPKAGMQTTQAAIQVAE